MTRPRFVLLREWEVRAIMDGRLTMLARPVRPQPVHDDRAWGIYWDRPNVEGRYGPCAWGLSEPVPGSVYLHSPFGAVGDVLLGKEKWGFSAKWSFGFQRSHIEWGGPWLPHAMSYAADGVPDGTHWCWRPAQHMPPWAVRILLRVEGVSCKRAQEITKDEAIACGLYAWTDQWTLKTYYGKGPPDVLESDPRNALARIWNADNPRHPWASNPWCWLARVGRVTP